MGEALGIGAFLTIVAVIVLAVLARMVAQIMKDSGHEKKVTECVASLNVLMTHIAVYKANDAASTEQAMVINRLIDAWNQRYRNWRGFEKIPGLAPG